MNDTYSIEHPHRISDLIAAKAQGLEVTCHPEFDVVPVNFLHRDNPFQAYIFLCTFTGEIGDKEYSFRKCYARGCPHNLCPHVSQAVMIANRYLQRDYRELKKAGIEVEEKLFSLEEMLVKFDQHKEEQDPTLTIEDYINIAKEGNKVHVNIDLELVPAVEHFANHQNSQTFLTVDFTVECLGKRHNFQRCFSCYQTDKENEQKPDAVRVANGRLEELYEAFDRAGISYNKEFFLN